MEPKPTLLNEIKQWNQILPDHEYFERALRLCPKITNKMGQRWEVVKNKVGVTNKSNSSFGQIASFVSGRQRLDVVFDCMFSRLNADGITKLERSVKNSPLLQANLRVLDVNITSRLDKVASNHGILPSALRMLGIVPHTKTVAQKKGQQLTQLIRTVLQKAQAIVVKPPAKIKQCIKPIETHDIEMRKQETKKTPRNPDKKAPSTSKGQKKEPRTSQSSQKKESETAQLSRKKEPRKTQRGKKEEPQDGTYSFDKPLQVFSTPKYHDLRPMLLSAFDRAQDQITIFMYSVTDNKIMEKLEEKAKSGVKVRLLHDKDAFKYAHRPLDPAVTLHRLDCKHNTGLMHLKLIAIDDELSIFGSANFTTEALTKDRNVMTPVKSRDLTKVIHERATKILKGTQKPDEPIEPSSLSFKLESGATCDFSFLSHDPKSEEKFLNFISSAQKSLDIAIYTFTQTALADRVIDLHKKKVKVQVVIDGQQANGAGNKIWQMLETAGVPTIVAKPNHFLLIHHKFARVDGVKVAHGSGNFTVSAFKTNEDCLGFFDNLSEEERNDFGEMWDTFLSAVNSHDTLTAKP
jgi:phosphatidylserine/phosphatidylglycerophosphate/cardiolipin synthase-like enzyme